MRTIFLDRDGVINHDPGEYTASVDTFYFLQGTLEALEEWTQLGYQFIGVTNQGGIAKGLYSLEDFYAIDHYMLGEFAKNHIRYLETFFCPHHHSVGRCICRKPDSGMLERAMAKYCLCPADCLLIGDSQRDLDAARKVGIHAYKVEANQGLSAIDPGDYFT